MSNSLTIRIVKGTWFRQCYEKTKPKRFREIIDKTKAVGKIIINENNLKKIPLRGGVITVGRHSRNDLVVDAEGSPPYASRYHCIIGPHLLGHWTVQDVGSTNGTVIHRGNKQINVEREGVQLISGDVLILGKAVELLIG